MPPFTPSRFFLAVEPTAAPVQPHPETSLSLRRVWDCEFPSQRLTVYATPTTGIAHDASLGITVVLHGETYDNGDDTAGDLLRTYRQAGAEGIGAVHGSFVAVVCDARDNRLLVVTDRINSRKAYLAREGATTWLASSPDLLPRGRFELDPIGVAWYLTHGTIYNHRTAFRGIRLLERACVHVVLPARLESQRYWIYSFASPSAASERELSDEMGRLLIRAVHRRLGRHATIFLALSAGYDSAGILGALGKSLKVPEVRCFSYAQGTPRPGSDEYVSAQMAKAFGYSHRIVQSFDGSAVELLRQNVAMGERTCEEIDAWLRMAHEFDAAPDPVLFAGDECLGWTDYLLTDDTDVLHAVQIAPGSSAGLLRRLMPGTAAGEAIDGMAADGDEMLARCPSRGDRHDMKDYLYLDQRMPQTIMMWREFNAGRFVPVVNPLLDYDLLDFMRTVPTRWRRQKLLYRRTMHRMYPEAFRFRRARFASAQLDARTAVYHQRDELQALLKNRTSRLDSLIDPDAGWQLLRELPDPRAAEYPTLQSRLRRRLAATIDSLGVKNVMRRFFRPTVPVAPLHQTAWRWLVLRTALGTPE